MSRRGSIITPIVGGSSPALTNMLICSRHNKLGLGVLSQTNEPYQDTASAVAERTDTPRRLSLSQGDDQRRLSLSQGDVQRRLSLSQGDVQRKLSLSQGDVQRKLSLGQEDVQQTVQQTVQEREKELKEIQQAVETLKRSGPAAEENTEMIFLELLRSIDRRRSEVKELIKAQQRAAVSEAEGMVEKLTQEIAELKRGDAKLLQSNQSLSSPSVSSDLPSISIPHLQFFSQVTQTVSDLREKLEDVIIGEWSKISFTVSTVNVLLSSEPKTREDFLPYACQLTLDPNTASTHLSLSEENRKVTHHDPQPYPDHPDRFTGYTRVLCREGLCGRGYWEVEWSGHTVDIAVSYKGIIRKDKCYFGGNDKSWMFRCSEDGYCFRHNKVETQVSGPQSSKVGVYLDHKEGTLAFYSVSDTVTLLHRVQTTFNQPLYPGFLPWNWGSSAEISKLW